MESLNMIMIDFDWKLEFGYNSLVTEYDYDWYWFIISSCFFIWRILVQYFVVLESIKFLFFVIHNG